MHVSPCCLFFCLNSHLSETSLPAKSIDCAACNWEWCIFSVQHFCTVRSGSYSLIPNATCRRSLKTHRQAGREAPAHTHTHTHFVSHRIRLTEKGNLDHHGTVKLTIKAQTNDVSSLLYLFRGRGRSRIHVNTPRHAQIQLPNPNMSPGLLKISTALKYWITFGPLLLSICFETHIKWSLSAFHQ